MTLDRDHPDQVRCPLIDHGEWKSAKVESTRVARTEAAEVRKLCKEAGRLFDVIGEVTPQAHTFGLEELDRRKELRVSRSRELDPQLRLQPASRLSEYFCCRNRRHRPRLKLRYPPIDFLVPGRLHVLVSREAVDKTLHELRPIFRTQLERRCFDGVERF